MRFLTKCFAISAMMFLGISCTGELWDKIEDLENQLENQGNQLNDYEKRLASLEALCSDSNTNISSLQTIVEGLKSNVYVTGCKPVVKEGEEIGYVITFSDGQSVTIYHGDEGQAPVIGVKADDEGIWYWTLNGDWLKDEEGNKFPVSASTPKMKVETGKWFISYDGGKSWKAVDVSGESGNVFQSVRYDDEFVYLLLADGTLLTIPLDAAESSSGDGRMAITLKSAPTGSTYASTGLLQISKLTKGVIFRDADGLAEGWTPSGDNRPKNVVFDVTWYDANKDVVTDIPAKLSTAKYIEFSTEDISQFYDGKTYLQTLKIYNSKNCIVQEIDARITKVMPTIEDLVSFRPMQELEEGSGLFKAYMIPDPTASTMKGQYVVGAQNADYGYKDLQNVFYSLNENIMFKIANAKYNEESEDYTDDLVVKYRTEAGVDMDYAMKVAGDLIDDKTIHPITVMYNFGPISNDPTTKDKDGNLVGPKDYVLESTQDIKVIFSCWHCAESFVWQKDKNASGEVSKDWTPSPKWTSEGSGDSVDLAYLLATNSYNNDFFGRMSLADILDLGWLKLSLDNGAEKMELVYQAASGNQVNPYFTPKFEEVAGRPKEYRVNFIQIDNQVDSAPVDNHEETLNIYVKDAFGHETIISSKVNILAPGGRTL